MSSGTVPSIYTALIATSIGGDRAGVREKKRGKIIAGHLGSLCILSLVLPIR
jgi:predicted amidohydrolase YtcJ